MPTLRNASPTTHTPALGFRVWRHRQSAAMTQAHTHPDIELNYLQTGSLTYILAGRRVMLTAGQLGIFWGGVPHQLITSANVTGIWLTLPLAWFLTCQFPNQLTPRLMTGELLPLPLPQDRAPQWLADFSAKPPRRRPILLELEALLHRAAATTPDPLPQRPLTSTDTAPLDTLTAYLAAHYRESITINTLARLVDRHPKYLMAAFRKSTGLTINTYLLRLRLAHAQRLLSTTSMPVLDIALDSGFTSPARFYQAFAHHIGERPLAYRKRHAE